MEKNEKERSRKCLRAMEQMRKAIEEPEVPLTRQQEQTEGCQGIPKDVGRKEDPPSPSPDKLDKHKRVKEIQAGNQEAISSDEKSGWEIVRHA